MRKPLCKRLAGLGLAAALLSLAATPPCQAGPLPPGIDPAGPVILGFNGRLAYDAGSGNFHSQLTPLFYTAGDTVTPFTGPGTTVFDLFVDRNGDFARNGTGFRLTGNVRLGGTDYSGDLLLGRVTGFGAEPAGPPSRNFGGLFDIEGGALTGRADFPVGSTGAFILTAENVRGGTLGDFTQNFSSDSAKVLIGPVAAPEPPSWILGLVGVGTLAGWGLLRKRRQRPRRAVPLGA
jgi:hypothetical protein